MIFFSLNSRSFIKRLLDKRERRLQYRLYCFRQRMSGIEIIILSLKRFHINSIKSFVIRIPFIQFYFYSNSETSFKMSPEPEIHHEDEYECLLDHIILPRVLPQSRHRNLLRHELLLLRRMVDTIDNCSKWIPNATADLFHSMKRVHCSPSKVEVIHTEINALRPGGTFAMFVRKQNCGFMIHMPKEQDYSKSDTPNTVIVSTFPGNLHPREVYSHPSDLEVSLHFYAVQRSAFSSSSIEYYGG